MDLEEDHGTDLEDFGMGYLDDKTSWIYANAMLTATTATTTTITTTRTSSCGDIT
jgi:hypothetical protein